MKKERTAMKDYFMYFHGRIRQASQRAVRYANEHQNRVTGIVQWGKHGTMPMFLEDIFIVAYSKDIEYPFMRQVSSSDTMNLYHYNEAVFRKRSSVGRQSLQSALEKHWPEKFNDTFHAFINFSRPVDLKKLFYQAGI
jgi:hypothetical protein